MKIGLRHTFKNIFSDFIDGLLYKLGKRATYEENRSGSKTIIKEISDDGILDKATILLTPAAYSDARLHSVKTQGDELVTGFTNGTGYFFTTFTTSGNDITSAIISSAFAGAVSNSISVTSGQTYKITFDYTKNSGDDLRVVFSSAISGAGSQISNNELISASGSQTLYLTITSTITGYLQMGTGNSGHSLNASITNISVKDVSSDFDFERDSSATRVDSDGLIQDMQSITDPELVENGDFSELGMLPTINSQTYTLSDAASFSYSTDQSNGGTYSGKITADSSSTLSEIYYSDGSNMGLTSGNTYKVSVDVYLPDANTMANIVLRVVANNGSTELINIDTAITDSWVTLSGYFVDDDISKIRIFGYGGDVSDESFYIDNLTLKDVTFSEDVDLPRIDYTGGVGHILLEPASTNLLNYSEDFSQWTLNGTSVVDGGVSSIGLNYYTITNTGGGFLGVYSGASGISHGDTITASVYVKKGTSDDFRLRYGASINQNVDFNLDDGTIVSEGTNVVGTIQSMSDGWYRVTSTWTDATHTFNSADIALYTSSGNVEISGAQLEVLSYATSYIPTHTGTTVTRDAETLSGSGNDTLINSTEGVLYCEIAAVNDGTSRYLSLNDGSSSNRIRFGYTAVNNTYRLLVISGGSSQVDITNVIADATLYTKFAILYKQNDFAIYINGVKTDVDTSGSTPIGLSDLDFDNSVGGDNFYGKTKCLAVFDEALTDVELAALTS